MDSTRAVENLRNPKSEIEEAIDNKICIYETIINGYIKQEPCDTEDEPGSIHNYVDIKEEIIQDPTVPAQETELTTEYTDNKIDINEIITMKDEIIEDPKVIQETRICKGCDEEYCLKCPMLIRILDSDNPTLRDDRVRRTYSTSEMDKFKQHRQSNTDAQMYKCPHRTLANYKLQKHLLKYRCNTCGKQFKSGRTLMEHVKNIHNGKRKKCKCSKCVFESFNWRRMKEHLLNVHSGIKRFKCPRCAFKTSYKNTLKVHLRFHVDSKPIKREFWNKQTLSRHEKKVYTIINKRYKCHKCEYRTIYKSNLKQHVVKAHDAPKPLCPFKTNKKNLKEHITVTHNDDKPFKCDLCPKTFKQKRSLTEHGRNIHEQGGKREVKEKQYECCKCEYRTSRKSSCKRHVAAVHDGFKPFACPICPYKTAINFHLKQHIAIHNEDKPFKCDACPKMFKRKTSLTEHARNMHSNAVKREYKCCKCHYSTYRRSDLSRHAASVHEGLKPFACTLCTHKTTTSFNLKQHFATHNEDKPFKCDACPKMFKRKTSLMEHARNMHSNTEKKEYKCYKCNYRTRRRSDLNRHAASVHDGLKPYACTLCTHKATTSFNLKQHIATHNDDKPFKCEGCPKLFKLKASLTVHKCYNL